MGDGPKTPEPVEKVVVGPAGGPKVVRNKVETLRKRRFQPLVQRLKRARRSFSTRWTVPYSITYAQRPAKTLLPARIEERKGYKDAQNGANGTRNRGSCASQS